MNEKDENQNQMKDFFENLLKDAAQIITNGLGSKIEKNLEKFTHDDRVKELMVLYAKFDKSKGEEKQKIENKILAINYEFFYKKVRYRQPLIIDGDYMDFVNEIELLINDGFKINKIEMLNLLSLYTEKIIPVFQNRPRLPSFKNVWALKKPEFIQWINNRSKELEGLSVLQKRFHLKEEISTPGNEFMKSVMELERTILEDPESLKQNVNSLIHNIQDYYESYRILSGLLIAIYDLKDGEFDNNLIRSYYGNCFHTDLGLYSHRKVCVNNGSRNDNRLSLKEYFDKYPPKDIHLFYEYLIKKIKHIRLTGAHYTFLIDQNIDDLRNGICKIQHEGEVKDYLILYLQEVQELLYFYLVLFIYITSHFLYDNI